MLSICVVDPQIEPTVAEEFAQAQRVCYQEFAAEAAVTEVSSDELVNGRVLYVVARNGPRGELVGGLRLHFSFPGTYLPVEQVMSRLSHLGRMLESRREQGIAEVCGFWIFSQYRGTGLSGALVRAGVAAIPLHGAHLAIALSHHYVVSHWAPMGFQADPRLGVHPYPDARYFSKVILLDPIRLSTSEPDQRTKILALRHALRHHYPIFWSPERGEQVLVQPAELESWVRAS